MTTAADKALDAFEFITVYLKNIGAYELIADKIVTIRQSLQSAQETRADLVKVRDALELALLCTEGNTPEEHRAYCKDAVDAAIPAIATLNRHIGDE